MLADIVGTSLDEGNEIDALAGLPESEQRRLAQRAKAGEKVTARHAMKLLRRKEREQETRSRDQSCVEGARQETLWRALRRSAVAMRCAW